jgi:hypothetical protein
VVRACPNEKRDFCFARLRAGIECRSAEKQRSRSGEERAIIVNPLSIYENSSRRPFQSAKILDSRCGRRQTARGR